MTEDLTNWIEANPLRLWRTRTETSITRVAMELRCAYVNVYFWERGVQRPGRRNMLALAGLMGLTAEHLSTQWDVWLAQRAPVAAIP